MSYHLKLLQVDAYRVDAVLEHQVIASAVVDNYGWGVHTRTGSGVATVGRVDFGGDLSTADCRELAVARLHSVANSRLAGVA